MCETQCVKHSLKANEKNADGDQIKGYINLPTLPGQLINLQLQLRITVLQKVQIVLGVL